MTTMLTILTDNFSDWECAMAMAVGRSYYGFESLTATPAGKPVISAGGLRVTPDMAAEEVDATALDALLVCGGRAWESEDMPNIAPLVRAVRDKGAVIAAICAATRAFADAGVLDTIAHTGSSLDELKSVPGYRGAEHFAATPAAICSGNVITAPGTASFAFMAEIIQALGKDKSELDFYIGMHAAQFARAA
jgi:putative intracellular protease/amidase